MPNPWPLAPLEELLTPVSRPETVDAEKTYRILGAHWYAQGLYVKDTTTGAGIQAKALYRVKEGDFVYNRLFAWKGSFALATKENDGCYVSNEFPCFEVNRPRVDGRFLWRFFSRSSAWDEALSESAGGTPTSRNRLKEHKFLAFKIPLPPLDKQRRIVARIETLTARIRDAHGLRNTSRAAVELLMPCALKKVFKDPDPKITLGEVMQLQRGFDLPVQKRLPGPHPVFAANGKIGTHAEFRVKGPGVLTGRSGSVGAVNYVAVDFWPLNTSLFVKDFKESLPRMAYYLLRAVSDELKELSSHTAVPTLDRKKVHSRILVHLPAPDEQPRIVAHFDGLQAKVDTLTKAQSETAAELDALMPSILDKAFRGEL